jgi:CRP-like cAMP-binding protein
VKSGALGKVYEDGELIVRQNDVGDCMYVIQDGHVEVVTTLDGQEIVLAVRGVGEFFGEMAIFEKEVRSADVRASGRVRVLTIDRKNIMARIHEDPSLAFRIIRSLSKRIRSLSEEVSRLKRNGKDR